tara:strand:- start:195 stop:395 length:201 start_codon:yes stop_codon:yes gene_type:complete
MANKYKVGNLVGLVDILGIVMEIGLDYPDNQTQRRSKYAVIRWSDGSTMMYFKDYGRVYSTAEVIG